jgi:hypothetical protein
MHDRMQYRLTWLAVALSLGHYLDHLIRESAVGRSPAKSPSEEMAAPALGLAAHEFPRLGLMGLVDGPIGR